MVHQHNFISKFGFMHNVMSHISLKFSKRVLIRILLQVFNDFFIWRAFVFLSKLLDIIIHVLCNFGTHEISQSWRDAERWLRIVVAQSLHAASLAIDNLDLNTKKFPIHINSLDRIFGKLIALLLNVPWHPVHFPVITASGTCKEGPINL